MPPIDHLPGPAAPVPCLALATLDAGWLAPPNQPTQVLHLDCSAPPCHYPQGVCHQVSQLLSLRRAGVEIRLHRVHPLLARILRALKVASLFAWGA